MSAENRGVVVWLMGRRQIGNPRQKGRRATEKHGRRTFKPGLRLTRDEEETATTNKTDVN